MTIIDYMWHPFYIISVFTIAVIYNGILKELVKCGAKTHRKNFRRSYHYILLWVMSFIYFKFMLRYSVAVQVEESQALGILLLWLESIFVYEIGLRTFYRGGKALLDKWFKTGEIKPPDRKDNGVIDIQEQLEDYD